MQFYFFLDLFKNVMLWETKEVIYEEVDDSVRGGRGMQRPLHLVLHSLWLLGP